MNHLVIFPPSFIDTLARRPIAEDLGSNVLVRAPAGSGQPTELVSRTVPALAPGAARLGEMAARTCTRKVAAAAGERLQAEPERVCAPASWPHPGRRPRVYTGIAGAAVAAEPIPVLAGVMEQVLEEADGWVGLDYERHVGAELGFDERLTGCGWQVASRADAGRPLMGEGVKERVLVSTARARVKRW